MRNAILFFVLIMATALFTIGCKKGTVKYDGSTNLKLNECTVQGKNFTICFDSLITDSRCPYNVECVWAGVAIAKFSLHQNNTTVPFYLATNTFSHFNKDTAINKIKISLQDILPHPSATPSHAASIVAVLKID